jgi:3-oxoacyl-(acyl-carrier-protein) synthase
MSTSSYLWRETRIVGTAVGVCTPHGMDADALGTALRRGEPLGDAPNGPLRVDAQALDAALAPLVPFGDQRRMDRLTRFGSAAGLACVRAAGLTITDENRDRFGVLFNTAFGAVASTDEFMATASPHLRGASPLLFPYTVQNACTGMVTILLGARGVNTTVSGMNPIVYASDLLRTGRAAAMLAGGYDELTGPIAGALSRPARLLADGGTLASDGWAEPIAPIAEGAVAVMLETAAHAAVRGAVPLFEIVGYGTAVSLQGSVPATVDNMRAIEPAAVAQAMRAALRDAAIPASMIDAVIGCARHDNGQRDAEDEALGAVFGVPPEVLRPKPLLGEMLGASDALAVAAAVVDHAARRGTARASAERGESLGSSFGNSFGGSLGRPAAVASGESADGDGSRLVLVNGLQLGGLVSSLVLRLP